MKLLAPLGYVRIKHSEKRWYDFYIPALLAVIALVAYHFVGFKLSGTSGLTTQINGLIQVLIGFYIAALAAVATFGNSSIDEVMSGTPPTIIEEYRGRSVKVSLTRRRFLSYLFGYLALISLCLFCLGLVVNLGATFITSLVSKSLLVFMKYIFLFIYSFLLMNIITTTLLGLYYLSIRIHQD